MQRENACFTGHRQLRDPIPTLFSKTEQEAETLIRNGYRFFGAGGARGFNSLAAEVMIKLKEKYPHIHLILVLAVSPPLHP